MWRMLYSLNFNLKWKILEVIKAVIKMILCTYPFIGIFLIDMFYEILYNYCIITCEKDKNCISLNGMKTKTK